MKKTLIVSSCLLLLFIQVTLAQRNAVNDIDRENFFRIGAKGGVNVNKIPGYSYKQGFNYNYFVGGFMQFNFSKRFGIQPEVNFVQSTATFSNNPTDIGDDLFHGGTQKNAPLNYLEIPVLLNINVGESRHVKLQVGPQYGMFLKGAPNSKSEESILYKNGELSGVGGFWMQLPFIYIGGRYQYGLSNIYSTVTNQSGKSQAIEIFTGFTF